MHMLTTVELPDELLTQAKIMAEFSGISLGQFLMEAVQNKLTPRKIKTRKELPTIGDANAPMMMPLTPEQIDEAMFG